ncbi:hypothetical protein [Aquabacterium sp. A08]|uniref:hypothetical protein n=1 Tax=Aquabacterium sp. A08 TaxID=2718532 RepID=UPI001421DF97|nr:hypothetical protein [Aquabacterium sp. A08]NIC41844.1 hypothetical protein [Aquabacterium sp. A08]
MRIEKTWFLLPLILALSGCATHYTDSAIEEPYGFFSGVWHGLIFLFSVLANIVSWFFGLLGVNFLDSIGIIGRPNTGLWYYIGFALGVMGAAGGSGR